MDFGLFNFLEGMSPWWWVSFGVALAALEMIVASFFLIWPGLAAVIMAVLVWLMPSMLGEVQVVVFALLSILLFFLGRRIFQPNDEPETGLNDRTKQLIGKHAKVVLFDHGEGRVEINGLQWVAKWDGDGTSTPGDTVIITAADGMSVRVEPV